MSESEGLGAWMERKGLFEPPPFPRCAHGVPIVHNCVACAESGAYELGLSLEARRDLLVPPGLRDERE